MLFLAPGVARVRARTSPRRNSSRCRRARLRRERIRRVRRPSGWTAWRTTSPRSLPPQATAPEHARAVDALRDRDPVGYAEAIDDLVGAHLAQRDEQRTADLLTGLGSAALARAWTPPMTARRSGSAWPGSSPTERLLAELPAPDRADVVVVLDAGRLGMDRALLAAAAPRIVAVAAPGGPDGPADAARPAVPGVRAGDPRPAGRDPGPGRAAHPAARAPCPCRAARWSRPAPDRGASRFPGLRRSPNVATVTQNRTDDHPVSRFGHVEPADLPDDLRERIEAVAEKSGFVPNVFRALARRPAELRAFLDYHDALMEREGGLSKAERELVVVATSGANHCVYCVVAHGAILRIRAKDTEIADRVATNPWTAPLLPRERAIVDLALVLATEPARLRPSTSTPRAPRGSTTTRSGTSAPSPRCSRSPTGWRT